MFMSFVNAQTIPKSINKPLNPTTKKKAQKIVVKQIPVYKEKTNDSDGDGLTDAIDECPDEKGTPKNGGCPELVEPKTSEVKNEPETISNTQTQPDKNWKKNMIMLMNYMRDSTG